MILNGLMRWMMKPLQYSRGGSVLRVLLGSSGTLGINGPGALFILKLAGNASLFSPSSDTIISGEIFPLLHPLCARRLDVTSETHPAGVCLRRDFTEQPIKENVFQDMPAENFKDYFSLSLSLWSSKLLL